MLLLYDLCFVTEALYEVPEWEWDVFSGAVLFWRQNFIQPNCMGPVETFFLKYLALPQGKKDKKSNTFSLIQFIRMSVSRGTSKRSRRRGKTSKKRAALKSFKPEKGTSFQWRILSVMCPRSCILLTLQRSTLCQSLVPVFSAVKQCTPKSYILRKLACYTSFFISYNSIKKHFVMKF